MIHDRSEAEIEFAQGVVLLSGGTSIEVEVGYWSSILNSQSLLPGKIREKQGQKLVFGRDLRGMLMLHYYYLQFDF